MLPANALMAAVIGSTVAQITLMSRLAVPEMKRAGHARDAAAAPPAAGGWPAPVLPPSMLLIVHGVIAQVPIGDLFLAVLVLCWRGYREITPAALWPALIATARTSASILMLIAAASLHAWLAAFESLPALVAARLGPCRTIR